MTAPASDSTRRKRIAVIAVHGVADQQPEETANTAANLLLHMQVDGDEARYRGFKTHRLRIAHRAVKLMKPAPTVSGDASEQCQHQFLRGQLEEFEEPDPGATYQTIRNEGVRADKEAGDREVHIYEMYWADLSRLGNSFYTFFVELYQLLFHLCTVGAKTARFARTQHEEIRAWRRFSRCISFASYCIRLAVPIGNLFVLAIIALAASGEISLTNPATRTFVIAILSILAGGALGAGLRRLVGPLTWPLALLASAAAFTTAWFILSYLTSRCPVLIGLLLYIELWGLLLFALCQVLKAYNRRHPHAIRWGIILAVVSTGLLILFAITKGDGVYNVSKRSAVALLMLVGASWAVAIFTAAVAWVSGWRALKGTPPDSRPTARRAIFTANLTIALTGTIMLILNIALWGLIPALLRDFVPSKFEVIRQIALDMQKHLRDVTILPGMTTLVMLMAAAALWMIWALIPAVRSEITTPKAEEQSSLWIGKSLTNAFSVMTWAGFIALACFGALLALLSALEIVRNTTDWFGDQFPPNTIPYLDTWDKGVANTIFTGFSGAVLLFLVAPFFLKGFMSKLSAGFRQGLDVALDVINYLREHPRDSTIRAQIFARYVSLLRYVCNWKSPVDGRGYDSIVIFAHSQGTVITVDLLRFLQVEPDSELSYLDQPDRIQLFTMGSPLRQLYGLRFPHIYDWARHDGKERPAGAPLSKKQRPDPSRLLSVGKWVNAYRSGDYVGRNLWRSEQDKDVYDPDPKAISEDKGETPGEEGARPEQVTRREFCIGGGAHTHYWDKTAPRIVEELDELIATA